VHHRADQHDEYSIKLASQRDLRSATRLNGFQVRQRVLNGKLKSGDPITPR
jgi:hypothetical protein